MRYVDADLYRYLIGRSDQSVNEAVMISRLDQQLRVNRLMLHHLTQVRGVQDIPPRLERYLSHYLGIITAVTSTMALRAGTSDRLTQRAGLWSEMRRADPALHRRLRRSTVGVLATLPGAWGEGRPWPPTAPPIGPMVSTDD
ncbi:hypothetical protein [Nesterenkonia pannonica]|uniref:hypothetical protein n=1 Tax=Nesterenkonia pannonica TaxID=1548602 RepID=UPI00216470A3|nr:hypothetical protein [Nesterenkonia pannonica]